MRKPNFPIQCLVVSWVIAIFGLGLGVVVDPDHFGRSGSLVVLFAVVSEYALLKAELQQLYNHLEGQGAAEAGNRGIPNLSPSLWHQKQALMSHITIVIGTFIWGFGDIWLQ
ncbi:hypothetical protein [Marinobacter nauticus]|uniref:hypothetical protein n=1 Tax=Marinobacter nauticus TaxID=2743 RepID=UPI001C57B190|nr:hypothetical protein [Marinobacter nauticus]MBW3197024.1 hypothetical protein [Marinobacter nauticus]MBY6182434.1 hypothetical protein [Marinobacter nauticus]